MLLDTPSSSESDEMIQTGDLSLRRESVKATKNALGSLSFWFQPMDHQTSMGPRPKVFRIFRRGSDMRLRLGFLRRRHTDTTISSVRPQPEEAKKWSESFLDLMSSKYGQSLFRAFLQREYSEENVDFWLAIEDFKKSRPNKLNGKAQKIYNDYVAVQAPKEVNLDSTTRSQTITNLAHPNRHCFDQAQKRVQGLMERDAYLRFLQSELYTELTHPEKLSPNTTKAAPGSPPST